MQKIYQNKDLTLYSFFGGHGKGMCLKIGIEDKHIDLTKPEVLRLISELLNWTNRT